MSIICPHVLITCDDCDLMIHIGVSPFPVMHLDLLIESVLRDYKWETRQDLNFCAKCKKQFSKPVEKSDKNILGKPVQ